MESDDVQAVEQVLAEASVADAGREVPPKQGDLLGRAVRAALAEQTGIQDLTLAHFYGTAPVDSSGPDYVNTVVRFTCTLAPENLLDRLQHIEQEHGRTRLYRNAPRTLDLDLLLYGQEQINTERLIVPHPRMHERAYVGGRGLVAIGILDHLVLRHGGRLLRRGTGQPLGHRGRRRVCGRMSA